MSMRVPLPLSDGPTPVNRPLPVVEPAMPGVRALVQVAILGLFAGLIADSQWILYGGVGLVLYALERILAEVRRARREAQEGRDWMD